MIRDIPPRAYVQLLNTRVSRLAAFGDADLHIPAIEVKGTGSWIAGRGGEVHGALLKHDPRSQVPLSLRRGGTLETFLRVEPFNRYQLHVVSYRIAIMDLPDNVYGLKSFRYDWRLRPTHDPETDPVLHDNPQHPHAHVHINFLHPGDKDCRLPTGPICPILLLCAFDHWYCRTFGD